MTASGGFEGDVRALYRGVLCSSGPGLVDPIARGAYNPRMRASQMHIVTYREDPTDAEVVSHRLMSRAGYIFKISSGLYAYSPMLWRSLRKIEQIIREELEAASCLEMQLPILQDSALWRESGRWDVYKASGTMFEARDRKGTTYGLAPTAEEVVTAYARATARSYKKLPLTLYQIHTKFRDELRPRFGLMRGKEFIMKDAYSFDASEAGLDASFERMKAAYYRLFHRMGLESFGVDADSGDIGGSGSMEFMMAADTGEDAILIEESSGYAANIEKAASQLTSSCCEGEDPRPMHIEDTPDVRTVEELDAFFADVTPDRMVKTVLFKAVHADNEQLWAALIRGDQDVNEIKLRNYTGGLDLQMLSDGEILQHTGAPHGFAGPIGLPDTFQIVADVSVAPLKNLLCGVNQADKHALDVNLGRDFPTPEFTDFRLARAGEPGPVNGDPLVERRGIEVGHIFKLGTKYSAAMGARCLNQQGKEVPFVMGCYGIGVSRVAAAAVEQFADDKGVVWPTPIAPFEVVVGCLTVKKAPLMEASEALVSELQAAGIDVLFDDRKMSPGAKMKDLELLGFPYAVLVGRSLEKDGKLELRHRRTGEVELLAPADVAPRLVELIEAERRGIVQG